MATPVKRFEAAFTSGLQEIGFRKRKGTIHTIELSPNVLGYVAENTATQFSRAGEFEVAGIVGVRHQEVERIVAQLDGEKFHPYMPPSVVRWVTYLNPSAVSTFWDVDASNAEEIAGKVCEEVRLYGLPFMQNGATLPGLIDYAQKGYGFGGQLERTLAVAFVLNGEPDKGRELLETKAAKIGDADDAWSESFRQFVARFKQWIDERGD